jgi:hypothetical protein
MEPRLAQWCIFRCRPLAGQLQRALVEAALLSAIQKLQLLPSRQMMWAPQNPQARNRCYRLHSAALPSCRQVAGP